MKKWFICPNGKRPLISDCLDRCIMDHRCCSPATLALVADNREWRGVTPSMAGKGDRQIYLEQTVDYAVRPTDSAFMTLGTRHHTIKEVYSGEHGEKGLGGSAGTIDDYEEATCTLYDYKSTGSGKLNRMALKTEIPTGEKYVKGQNKGKSKTIKIVHGFEWEENDPWVFQMNQYRLGMEALGYKVNKMFIEATLRDGGTYTARNMGFHKNIYMIEVPKLPDEQIEEYYKSKEQRMAGAFRKAETPPPCSETETWDERRKCKYYCDVFEACAKAGGWEFGELRNVLKERKRNG